MGQRHKQRLESCLSCTVTESAPVGAAQPEYSSQPKGWYGESKRRWVCVWVYGLGVWVCGLSEKWVIGVIGEEGNDEALIPNRLSNIYNIFSAAAVYNSFIQIQKVMGLT